MKKFIESKKISDWEVLTDDGFVDIEYLHTTIPYEVYNLKLSDGKELKCADNHILFYRDDMEEVYAKNLSTGDKVCVLGDGKLEESEVISIENLGYEETMYDLQLSENSNHRYYTNGILSHNTELAKVLAESWYNGQMVRLDMSEFMEKISSTALTGSPPGYVGHDKGGKFEQIRRNPYSLVLLDEIEKANPDVLNTLLQVLDEGELTDGSGRKINFRNCIIIMTSNLGARETAIKSVGFGKGDNKLNDKSIEMAKKFFTPEIWNRIDEVIVFEQLNKDQMTEILDIELEKVRKMLKDNRGYNLKVGKKAKTYIVDKGYSDEYGARFLKRTINQEVTDVICEYLLSNTPENGATLVINVVDDKIVIDSKEA